MTQLDEAAIFNIARHIQTPEARRLYIEQTCGDDPRLQERVEALLRVHDREQSFLASPALNLPTLDGDTPKDGAADRILGEGPGTQIGPYKLMEQIGEGGFGVVFLAEQQKPVRRQVAVKILKPGMDSRQIVARFEAERQALALMDHPNIARVLDGGVAESGRPYFVMDLVKGISITKYCDEHQLTLRERLALFLPICQAVQHAHQKGIIHRDLKPSNVLVADSDPGGPGVPKVIDFGVAKAIGRQLSEQTLTTGLGAIIGTPEYMSPEQADFAARDIDTRADIYGLGVLLYELLTGTTPLTRERLKQEPVSELLRIIREEEPPKPSSRVISATDSLPSVAAMRNLEPARLTQELRGELDWIVMKSLEKDRDRRYATANALALDIERFLNDETVEACPPSAGYRVRKFVRKNRKLLAVAAAFVLLLTAGTVVSLWQAVRATRAERVSNQERDRAEGEKQISQAVRQFLQTKLLSQADTRQQANVLLAAGRASAEAKWNPTIGELLDRAAAELTPDKIEAQFPNQPLVQAEILQTIGDAYRGVGRYGPAIAHLERARDLRQRELGPDHPDTLITLHNLATTYHVAGKLPDAIDLYSQVRDKQNQELGPDHPDTLTTLHNLATAYVEAGRAQDAIPLFEQVRERQIQKFGPDHPRNLITLSNLAAAYQATGRLLEATRLYGQVRDKEIQKLGPDHPDTLDNLNNLAIASLAACRIPEAICLLEQVRDMQTQKLGPDHPKTLHTLHNLASAYKSAGRLPEAIRLFEQVRDMRVEKLGADHPQTLTTLDGLASAYRDAGRLPEAIRLYEQVRDKRLEKLGSDHTDTLLTLNNLALAYQDVDRLPEAIRLLEQVRDKRIEKFGPDHPETVDVLNNLGTAYWHAQRFPEAIRLYEEAGEKRAALLGPDHLDTLKTLNALASAYDHAGRVPDAIRLSEQVRAKLTATVGPDHPETLMTMGRLALLYRDTGRLTEAVPLLKEALSRARKLPDPKPANVSWIPQAMAETYDQAGQFAKAEPLYRESLQQTRQQSGTDHLQTASALAQLGSNLLYQNKSTDAEAVLRECLAIRAKKEPDAWTTFNTKSMLGGALLLQKKHADAEPLLRQGYEGMKQREAGIPLHGKVRLTEALDRLVRLYEAKGQKDKADEWRQKLAKQKKKEIGTPPSEVPSPKAKQHPKEP